MLYETRRGAKCIPMPGPQKKNGDTLGSKGITYVLMQMLPAHPQRIEWVREDNLRQVEDKGRI